MEHLQQDNYKNDKLLSLKPFNITAITFKSTWKNETALTSHMCKVVDLSPKPIQYLIPPSREVNADDTADKIVKSSSTQATHLQPAEEFVVTADATKGLDTSESAEVQGNQPKTDDAAKTNDANITFMGFGPINMELDDTGFDIHSMPNDDLASLTGFETLDLVDEESNSVTKEHSADNLNVTSDGDIALPNASAGFSALSDPLVIFEES
ncbi:hypothetical protein Tco_0669956 [Tanacetum coccineum]